MRSILVSSLAVTAILATGWVRAAEPVKLEKAELERVLTGKSISYRNVNGAAAIVSFESNGRVTYRSGNAKPATGTWQADDDGRYCIKITSAQVPDHCRRVLKTDSGHALSSPTGELIPISGLD